MSSASRGGPLQHGDPAKSGRDPAGGRQDAASGTSGYDLLLTGLSGKSEVLYDLCLWILGIIYTEKLPELQPTRCSPKPGTNVKDKQV